MENSIIANLRKVILEGDAEKTKELAQKSFELGIDPLKAIESMADGVKEVGEKFGKGEVFLADLILAGEAMKAGISVLLPKIRAAKKERKFIGRVVIGTVKGDIHSIGKDIVATLLEAEGFEVINLGEDVPTEKFVEAVKHYKPDILGLSSLLTATMPMQKEVIDALVKEGLRSQVKVLIGGGPTTNEWAKEIGADGWAGDAVRAVELAKSVMLQRA
ncbi:MAG: corrinoid protein [Candidatus Bathyarchaeia archaeon]